MRNTGLCGWPKPAANAGVLIEENRLTDWKCKMLSGLTAFSVFIIEGAHGKSKIKTRRKILRIV